MRTLRFALGLTLAALPVFAIGCAAETDAPETEEVGTDEGELIAHAAIAGDYRWDTTSTYGGLETLNLDKAGSYTASVDAPKGIVCVRFPCTVPEAGSWRAYRFFGRTTLWLFPKGASARRYVAVHDKAARSLSLTRSGVTTKLVAPAAAACKPTGCSGQICADRDVMTTCDFRPEYACYQKATCARGADGACGWAETPELTKCIEDATKPPPAKPCVVSGCSGQICADFSMVTTCEYRPEYACYKQSVCERDASGFCGWRQSPALAKCLAGN